MEHSNRKLSFKEKLENIWYYYKWWILLALVFLFGIILAIRVVSLGNQEVKSDLKIVSLFAHPLTPNEFDLDKRLNGFVFDADNDGTKTATLHPYYITEKRTSDEDMVSQSKYEKHLRECDGDLLLFDAPNLAIYQKKDIFDPLEKYMDLSAIPEDELVFRDGVAVAVKLTDSKILKEMGFIIDEVWAGVMFTPDENTLPSRQNASIAIEKLLEKN